MFKRLSTAILIALLPTVAWAQQAVLQGGSQTSGHIPQYANTGGSTAVIIDGGTAAGGASGVNPSEIGITARGTGTAPYDAQGTGPNGTNFCNYDAPTTNADGYHALCMSPNVSSKGRIDYSYGGTATPQGLDIVVNGYTALSLSSTGTLSQSLTDGQFLVGNVSNLAADVAMSGDCTLANTGAVTCTTLNSVAPGDLYPLGYDSLFTTSGTDLTLANIASATVLGNSTGGATTPSASTVTSLLDRAFSSTQGSILYRDSTAWAALGPGSSGEVLSSGGAAANPSWIAAPGTGTVTSIATNNGVTGGTITTSGTVGLANISAGQILGNVTAGSTFPSGTSVPQLGIDATTSGTIGLANGGASGETVTVQNPSTTTAYNFNLPATAGSSGELLTSAGGGSSAMTWTATGTSGTAVPFLDGANTWGATQNLADNILQRPVLKDYGETVNAIGAIGGGSQDIDLTLGNVVTATVDTSETTFTFSNPSASGTSCSFTLILTNGGSQTVNWPAGTVWSGETAPSLTASGVDVLTFFTLDAGTTWYGFTGGLDMQ